MHIITKRRLREFWEKHADEEAPLRAWTKITRKGSWRNLAETRRDLPTADAVGDCTVFNIHGNHYRLITHVNYRKRRVYIFHVLTHAEYNRGGWKNDCN